MTGQQADSVLRNQEHTVESTEMEEQQVATSSTGGASLAVSSATERAFNDSYVAHFLANAEEELCQATIEKVRGELHWRIRHMETKRYVYDLYPEWRITKPVSFWEATLCSCPDGYVRGAPCLHKAILRVWCSRHRNAMGVKHLLDLPI